ncbi:MAG TPA: AAA family ATPase [Anaerolineaceae bacterium]|nr:AAA family ATPase [Anaerolineaceae bacterium]
MRSAATWRLVFTPLLICPLFIFLISLLVGTITRWNFQGDFPVELLNAALLGACATLSTSMLMSLGISFIGGLIFGLAVGLTSGLLFIAPDSIYLALGFCAGLAGNIMRSHLQMYNAIRLNLRNFFAVILWIGLIGLLVLFGLTIANEFFFNNELNVNNTYQKPFSPIMMFLDTSIVLISFFLIIAPPNLRKWKKAGFVSALIALAAILLTLGMHEYTYNNHLLFFVLAGLNYGVLFTMLFGITFSIISITNWKRPAIVLGALSAGSMWVPIGIFIFKGFSFNLFLWALTPIGVFLGLTFHLWRPLLLFVFQAFYTMLLYVLDRRRLPKKSSLLEHHPAFWDELNYISWPHLDDHLILLAQHDMPKARQTMLALGFGRQRQAVFNAHLELAAQYMENIQNIQDLNAVIAPMENSSMSTPFAPILQKFVKLAHDVEKAENQTTAFNTRTALAIMREQVVELERSLRFSYEGHAIRFLPIVAHWQELLTNRLDELARMAEKTKEIENPYVIAVPIKENRGVFVGRVDIFNQIEQLLLAPLRPPIFIYGQRRMGKTSLLLNLTRILPSTIPPMFIDCQELSGVKSYAEFFYSMVKQIKRTTSKYHSIEIPPLDIEKMPFDSPFMAFNLWLDQLDQILDENDQMGLFIFDEFVALDEIFWDGDMQPDDFLRLLRHIIQHRQNFRVLISGSNSLQDTDKWASYLVNTQIIKLGYLQEQESRQLIETPVSGFPLSYQPTAVNALLDLTRGHPYLIQMLCFELIQYKNSQPLAQRFMVTPEDIETILPGALKGGDFYIQAIKSELPIDGLYMLAMLAQKGRYSWIDAQEWCAAFPNNFDHHLRTLLQLDLIEPVFENGYRFQIELVRRWIEMLAKNNLLIR